MDQNTIRILFSFFILVSCQDKEADQVPNVSKEWPPNVAPEDNSAFPDKVPFPGPFPGINTGANPEEQPGGHSGNQGHQGGQPEPNYRPDQQMNKKCTDNIYRRCNRNKSFSQQQLENVRQFLFQTFTNKSEIKPENGLCNSLRIRRNWKCLSDVQRNRTIAVWQQMYSTGIIAKFTDTYSKNWGTWHKSPEKLFAMRRLTNQFEQAMLAIDPRVSLPYWEPWQYATHAERASVWNDLGTSGNYEGGYCVEDGSFTGLIPCLKRHWSPRGAIYPYITPEFVTEMIQNSPDYTSLTVKAFTILQQSFVNIGGYEGQLSSRDAGYDPIFWMTWSAISDLVFLRWQLQDERNLCPLSLGIESFKYNQRTSNVEGSDMMNDTITGIPSSTIRENCWLGFGDLCYIPDQLINVIDMIYTKQKDPTSPVAVQRIRAKPWLAAKYFPKIYLGDVSRLSHVFEEVGECNPMCDSISKPTFLPETEAGRKIAEEYAYALGIDFSTGGLGISEQPSYLLWVDMNKAGYCSPYVTR